MQRHLFVLVTALTTLATPAAGQQSCTGSTSVQDACRKTVDLVTFIVPQLSTAIAGGNATLGQGGALGGVGHFAVSLRGTLVSGSLPKIENQGFSTTGAQATTYQAEDQLVPAVTADAAIGLWRGYSAGATHVGGIDLLGSLMYMQDVEGDEVSVAVSGSGNVKVGLGVRIGILEESLVVPGVAFTWLKRDLPTLSISGRSTVTASGTSAPGEIRLDDLAVKTTTFRLTASKSLAILGLSAGIGQDKYESSANVSVTVNPPGGAQSGAGNTGVSMTRTNMFVGASLNLFLFKAVAEAGQVSGGSLPALLNNFGTPADKSRTYLTLGLRFGN